MTFTDQTRDGANALFYAVRDFHETFDQPHPDTPTMQTPDQVERRGVWIEEEVTELRAATDLIGQADAYKDILYFAVGGLVELGILPGELFNLVHAANMNKRHNIDGVLTVVKNATGKVVKPSGWVAPEPQIEAEVRRQAVERPLTQAA